MSRFAAFLRGINVGGNKTIKMDELKNAFEKMKFKNVKTILNSGNVVFDSKPLKESELEEMIEKNLEEKFGMNISVIVRSLEYLEKIHKEGPFKKIKVTPDTRLYISFNKEKITSKLKIPYESKDKNFRILEIKDQDIYSVLNVTPGSRSVDLMSILEKEYGKKITTRNWNTVGRTIK